MNLETIFNRSFFSGPPADAPTAIQKAFGKLAGDVELIEQKREQALPQFERLNAGDRSDQNTRRVRQLQIQSQLLSDEIPVMESVLTTYTEPLAAYFQHQSEVATQIGRLAVQRLREQLERDFDPKIWPIDDDFFNHHAGTHPVTVAAARQSSYLSDRHASTKQQCNQLRSAIDHAIERLAELVERSKQAQAGAAAELSRSMEASEARRAIAAEETKHREESARYSQQIQAAIARAEQSARKRVGM